MAVIVFYYTFTSMHCHLHSDLFFKASFPLQVSIAQVCLKAICLASNLISRDVLVLHSGASKGHQSLHASS